MLCMIFSIKRETISCVYFSPQNFQNGYILNKVTSLSSLQHGGALTDFYLGSFSFPEKSHQHLEMNLYHSTGRFAPEIS